MEPREDDDAFLSAIAEAEADSCRKRGKQLAEPAESVSSSLPGFRGVHHGDTAQGFDETESFSKRSKIEPEGDYMAALRGAHSETWQAMASRGRTDSKPSYGAPASMNSGFDGGAARGGATGACFHCGQEGHWARDCPTKSNPWGPDSSKTPSQDQVPDKSCPCGGGLCKVLTANTEKNAGRQFYRCPLRKEEGQCGYFEWCDGSTGLNQSFPKERGDSQHSAELPCPCGAGLCIMLTAKTEKNMGRQFFRCPLNQGEGSCGFFKWCDENGPASSTAVAHGGGSPYKNKGLMPKSTATGQCHKCGMDGHWARDCPSLSQNVTLKTLGGEVHSGPVGSGAMGNCFKCEQVGHWAKDCPNQQFSHGNRDATGGFNRYGGETNFSGGGYSNGRGYGSSGTGGGGRGSASSDTCYKCGSKGHWSKDCPSAGQTQGYGGKSQSSFSGGSNRGQSQGAFSRRW